MIEKVTKIEINGYINYVVEFNNGIISNVPDNPSNRYYNAVQQWLKDHEKNEIKKSSKE